MRSVRIIPCLLWRDRGLWKTCRFADPSYVGDPINTARLFNDKDVDELIMLDGMYAASFRLQAERYDQAPIDHLEEVIGNG